MAQYDFLSVSNGSGDAALMHIESDRLSGSTTIDVDTVTNVPAKFIATYGTIGPDGYITAASKREFRGHLSGSDLVIDAFEPGSTDDGNTAGQVVIIKPNTGWADRVATWIKNASGNGTPEAGTFAALTAAAITAASAALSGALTVGGNASITGNLEVTGTARIIPASVASAATITPTSQIYDVTAQAVTGAIAVPSFATQNGMSLVLRIRDNGTGRALSFASGYLNVSGLDTPTTTIANKLLTIGAIYNSANSKWEIQGINQQA